MITRERCRATSAVCVICVVVFFNDTATTEIYTLSLHDALPISPRSSPTGCGPATLSKTPRPPRRHQGNRSNHFASRSEEHTSELQSRQYLVCRLLLEKNNLVYLLLFLSPSIRLRSSSSLYIPCF